MKINLLIDNPDGYLSDYINFDPLAGTNNPKVIPAPIENLDYYVSDGEADEIRALNILTYFYSYQVDEILDNWIGKLSYNGSIILSEVDTIMANKAFLRGEIGLKDLNLLMYGEQQKKWDIRKCCLTLSTLSNILINNYNLRIEEKYFNVYNFVIRARRLLPEEIENV